MITPVGDRDLSSPLLRLPFELLNKIGDYLRSTDRVCFALSCKFLFSINSQIELKRLDILGPARLHYLGFLDRIRPFSAQGMPNVDGWRICCRCMKLRPRRAEHWIGIIRHFPKRSKWRCKHAKLRKRPGLPLRPSRNTCVLEWALGATTMCPQCALAIYQEYGRNGKCWECARGVFERLPKSLQTRRALIRTGRGA
jgi:hypothetical protein